jgi:transcriptional regulator with GAF, ATPase, and Fis domain
MIGESPVIQALKKQIRQVSRVDFTVTIQGESGTGKELIARAIHRLSPRRDKPFIAFNCASLPETLLEAELMGVAKGAFTDARENRAGLIEGAEGGTLFLDEIGEMPLLLQAKLLRFLSDHTIRRLGENQVRTVDCRVLCATHRDLGDMVAAKTFREDLFYRIQELTVLSPPLRHRQEDLPLLLDHFLKKYGFTGLGQTERHWLALKWMPLTWPGNIRELESRIKELITYHPHHPDLEGAASLQPLAEGPLHHSRSQFERLCVLSTLEKNGWSRNRSAAALGISRIGLFKLMRKHRITDPDTGPPF